MACALSIGAPVRRAFGGRVGRHRTEVEKQSRIRREESARCEYIMGNGNYVGQRSDTMRAPGFSPPSGRVGAHHKRRPRVFFV
eukprot:5646666-Prymnesium_polylepis.1